VNRKAKTGPRRRERIDKKKKKKGCWERVFQQHIKKGTVKKLYSEHDPGRAVALNEKIGREPSSYVS